MNWISVKERLPSTDRSNNQEGPGHSVLVLNDKGEIMSAYYTTCNVLGERLKMSNFKQAARTADEISNRGYTGAFIYNDHCCEDVTIVTHWMPLSDIPLPPKDQSNDL